MCVFHLFEGVYAILWAVIPRRVAPGAALRHRGGSVTGGGGRPGPRGYARSAGSHSRICVAGCVRVCGGSAYVGGRVRVFGVCACVTVRVP